MNNIPSIEEIRKIAQAKRALFIAEAIKIAADKGYNYAFISLLSDEDIEILKEKRYKVEHGSYDITHGNNIHMECYKISW